jgi:hypothetical protein
MVETWQCSGCEANCLLVMRTDNPNGTCNHCVEDGEEGVLWKKIEEK